MRFYERLEELRDALNERYKLNLTMKELMEWVRQHDGYEADSR